MNFEEYKNQKNPVRQYGVEIFEKDCNQVCVTGIPKTRIIVLKICERYFTYLLTEGDNRLMVMDEQGNPKKSSCFVWRGAPS